MTDIKALVERLEAADGPDRELDLAIRNRFGDFLPFSALEADYVSVLDGKPVVAARATYPPDGSALYLPRYTASIDAAVAFAERVLPGCYWRIEKMTPARAISSPGSAFWATCGSAGEQESAYAKTAPFALLIATLRALDQTTK